MIGRRLLCRDLASASANSGICWRSGMDDATPDERLREWWFGPLIDAEPKEVAAALVASPRRGADSTPVAPSNA